jgi:hypothetical protein
MRMAADAVEMAALRLARRFVSRQVPVPTMPFS